MSRRKREPGASIWSLYERLLQRYPFGAGWPDGEWPVSGSFRPAQFEVVVGAILTQNTSWNNVEKALRGMVADDLVSAARIVRCPLAKLERAIRSSGFFSRKARRLREISRFITNSKGDFYRSVQRSDLLSIDGIGPETADSILLYACHRPQFVVDAYTRRIFARYGLVPEQARYGEIQRFFEVGLPAEPRVYKRLHALIVEHAQQSCRKQPLCRSCVLGDSCRKIGVPALGR